MSAGVVAILIFCARACSVTRATSSLNQLVASPRLGAPFWRSPVGDGRIQRMSPTSDHDTSVAWAGPSPSEWAERLACDESLARALVCAAVRETFPFADVLRDTLRDAVQRPQTPLYADVSLAITRTLHPLQAIAPESDAARLRLVVEKALRSEGLL